MTAMLSPDLLDRRALALVALHDVFGRAVAGPVRLEGGGVRVAAKEAGRFAILAAEGLEAHSAAFPAPPPTPALRSRHVRIDITPAAAGVMARRFDLRLPRDADPAGADGPHSLFRAVPVPMLPSPRVRLGGSACAVRVRVVRDDDGRLVEGALVRGRSDDGAFDAATLSDARGEACLVFPTLPLAIPGAGATLQRTIAARVLVHADPASARFHRPEEAASAARAAAGRTQGHPDPDAIAAAFPPDFSTGAPVQLTAGGQPALSLSWAAP